MEQNFGLLLILGIQDGVNNYTTYDSDRDTVKFKQVIDKLSGDNEPTDELVTAAKDPRPNTKGRNYINIFSAKIIPYSIISY